MRLSVATKKFGVRLALCLFLLWCGGCSTERHGLNILFITADDLNWDSVGVFGSTVPEVTPNIDRLASQGMRFEHAHVTVSICHPGRAVWMTGRYPHNSGALGFNEINADVPTLLEAMRDNGYYTGILGKTAHVIASRASAWHELVPDEELGNGREPELYYQKVKSFFTHARRASKPFFLMVNAHDPHRPFTESRGGQAAGNGAAHSKRFYRPDEIEVPGFLPDLPRVRKELAWYYTAVRRADETVGEVLRALDESREADNTLVLFMSDNGMPFPFAKTNVWLHSTRTPWIVRWPGVVAPNAYDRTHFISGIDVAPTILDAAGLPPLPGADGRSIVPLLKGEPQAGRDFVFTHVNTIASGASYPMRSIIDSQFGYIYNAWSDGKTTFRNEWGFTGRELAEAARSDSAIAARVRHLTFRTKEELYDYRRDPDALHNLVNEPDYAETLVHYRRRMHELMQSTHDHLLEQFLKEIE